MKQRALRIAVAVAIAGGIFQPYYFKIWTINRAGMRAMVLEMPYRKTPGLRLFFEGVRAHTQRGDTIAVAAPFPTWEHGYDYVYSRSTYVLAGRRVLALRDPASHWLPENLARAVFIAGYRIFETPPGYAVVWRNADGVLLRRAK